MLKAKELIICKNCRKASEEYNFYKIITEKLNEETQKYEPYIACKNCVKLAYLDFLSNYSKKEALYQLCKLYNLYYDNSSECYDIEVYMKNISSLPQYNSLEFKDSSTYKNENNSIDIKTDDEIKEIEKDIMGIKSNMTRAIQSGDANLYGKWMNNYRDALQLREELKRKKSSEGLKDITTNFNINIDGSNIENINDEIIKEIINNFSKKNIKQV